MKDIFFLKYTLMAFGVILLTVLFFTYRDSPKRNLQIPSAISIQGQTFSLEYANTAEKRRKGLGERDNLCEMCAMLFIFDEPGHYAFWMGGMRFPLDIIWLLDNRVVSIERNIAPESQEIFAPNGEADRVLEINGGVGGNIRTGDTVDNIYVKPSDNAEQL